MLQIPGDFFEDEIRDGFYVSGLMKRVWAAQLQILSDVDELCTKYGIPYFVDWGTLLGTVRHGGYIPWDDDLDIGMMRADYQRFQDVASELGGTYRFLTVHTNKDYQMLLGRVVNDTSINMESGHLAHFHDCPFVMGIDIFPYDYIYRDEDLEQDRKRRCKLITELIGLLKGAGTVTPQIRELIRQAEKAIGRSFPVTGHLLNELYICLDDLYMECPEGEADEIADFHNHIQSGERYRLPKHTFEHLIPLSYEMLKVPVPAAYEMVLNVKYHDFLRPVRDWSSHEYPYYRPQMETLRKHRPEVYPPYEPVVSDLTVPRSLPDKKAEDGQRKTAVFLPFRAKYWESMEPLWEAKEADPEWDVYVIPLPYYDKNWDSSARNLRYDGNLFPQTVPITEFAAFPLKDRHPDLICFQHPWDAYGDTLTVHPAFYSDILYRCTDCLVCVPPLEPDASDPKDERASLSMDHFVTMPGILRADAVYVQSEEMRDVYVRKLMEFCSGLSAAESMKEVLQTKIRVLPDAHREQSGTDHYKGLAPEEWQARIRKPDGSFKKVLLYEIGASGFAQFGSGMTEKIERVLNTLEEQADEIAVLLRVFPEPETFLGALTQEQQTGFLDLLEAFADQDWGIFDASDDRERAERICDAYYGEAEDIIRSFVKHGKPVMIENPEI